jgi:hypothetical protein
MIALCFSFPEALPAWIFNLYHMRHVLNSKDRREFEVLALQSRTRGVQALRKAIADRMDRSAPASIGLLLQIQWLFGGECMLNEPVGAKAHAIVIPLLEQTHLDPEISAHIMINAMVSI